MIYTEKQWKTWEAASIKTSKQQKRLLYIKTKLYLAQNIWQ